MIRHRQHSLQSPQNSISPPVLGELNSGSNQVTLVLFQLGFKSLKQGERIGGGARKTSQHFAVVQLSHFAGCSFDNDVAQRDLCVFADTNHNKEGRHQSGNINESDLAALRHPLSNPIQETARGRKVHANQARARDDQTPFSGA